MLKHKVQCDIGEDPGIHEILKSMKHLQVNLIVPYLHTRQRAAALPLPYLLSVDYLSLYQVPVQLAFRPTARRSPTYQHRRYTRNKVAWLLFWPLEFVDPS